jgi:hypothetical protein
MPTILSQVEGPDRASAVNSSIVASAKKGHRHCRKVDSRTRQLHIHHNHSRIFHKMDRSKAAYKCELRHNQKIILAEHNLPIWGTQTHNGGQRKILRQCNVQRILLANWHEGCLRISIPPTVERSSQESKLFDLPSNEENIRGRGKENEQRSC